MACCGLARTIHQTVGCILKGEKVRADKELKRKRVHTCERCRFYDAGRCKVCGCFVKIKASLQNEQCPKGMW